jgi:hypothetical protein
MHVPLPGCIIRPRVGEPLLVGDDIEGAERRLREALG